MILDSGKIRVYYVFENKFLWHFWQSWNYWITYRSNDFWVMGLKSERVFWKHIHREIHCAIYNRIVLNVGLNLLLKGLVSLLKHWMNDMCLYLMGPHLSKGLKGTSNKMVHRKNKPFSGTTHACPFTWCEVVSGINARNKMNHTTQKGLKTLVQVKFFLEYHNVWGNLGLVKDVKGMNKYQSLDEYF